jgi:hypothetical protein
MAKNGNGKSTRMVSPLYESGRTNGPVAGPKGGKSPSDPLGYKSRTGDSAPGGSPGDRQASSTGEAATAH